MNVFAHPVEIRASARLSGGARRSRPSLLDILRDGAGTRAVLHDGARRDTTTERALGIDGASESVLYAAGAGKKPPGRATAERVREQLG